MRWGCCLAAVALCLAAPRLAAQDTRQLKGSVASYFASYANSGYASQDKMRVEDIALDAKARELTLRMNREFGEQPFTPSLVRKIYDDVRSLLPMPYNTYRLSIRVDSTAIERLVPVSLAEEADPARVYSRRMHKGAAWVTPASLPYSARGGLWGRHLCVWASHGKYYQCDKRRWAWQRPPLYCTSEDLFTQTIVVPYLIPMLENAGAVVFTPRERDWQRREIVVDNDAPASGGVYEEQDGKYAWADAGIGFARARQVYEDGDNPFRDGTARQADAVSGKRMLSSVTWRPVVEEEGDYAVYVSYKTLPTSVPDARYTVVHGGVATRFRVNQQMGGGTWAYLGTFHLTPSGDNRVTLTNQSDYRGQVTADAARFGGGMGCVARRDSSEAGGAVSGLPRFLEAARYAALWYGFPDSLYAIRGNDDYGDDINARALTENFLARGSAYLPGDSGLCVPLELSLAVHSDAGYRRDSSLVGTLGIYTDGFFGGLTGAGLSRLASRDLAERVMRQVSDDLSAKYGGWARRQLYNRNYGETRDPQFPAMILETLSHQNWADMRLGHDPGFRFDMARAIYKGVLRFLSDAHRESDCVTQPLPVSKLRAVVDAARGKATLSWEPTTDELDSTAEPTGYVVYTAAGDMDFDNGTRLSARSTDYEADLEPGVLYRFRVAAVNEGGRSMPGDEVCACLAGEGATELLVVDGFQRLAGPLALDNDSARGFDMETDPGVIDRRSPGYCGYQRCFSKAGYGRGGEAALGYSGDELEGMVLAGNARDNATRHAADAVASGRYNVSSCVAPAIASLPVGQFRLMDVAMGAQRDDGYSPRRFPVFSPAMMSALSTFVRGGGGVLLSGAYIGSDMQGGDGPEFTSQVLKYRPGGVSRADSSLAVNGLGTSAALYCQPNERNYWVRQADVIEAAPGAFCAMTYASGNHSAAVAYGGDDYRVMAFGFPLECITDPERRRAIVGASLRFLLSQ